MGFAILAFCCVFILFASAGSLMFYRTAVLKRISSVVTLRTEPASITSTLQKTSSSLSFAVEKLERVVPKTQAEVSVVQQRLIRAGFRRNSAVNFFYGTKVIIPLVLGATAFFTGIASESPVIICLAAVGLGYLGPDFWLGRKIKGRQKRVRLALPDVLDLLVICVEAGLGLDQATARTARELGKAHPAISDELEVIALEQRAGRARAEAWKHMAERTDVDIVRNLVSILAQSEQFGTSIAKTLRTHSDTLRTQRVQEVEEMAAKTTIKLIFPLVLFIFPCLFLVTLGPAVILMAESFREFLKQ